MVLSRLLWPLQFIQTSHRDCDNLRFDSFVFLKLLPHQPVLCIRCRHIEINMSGLCKCIFVIVVPEDISPIRTTLAEMICVYNTADTRRSTIFQNRLPDSGCTVDNHHIFCRQVKFPDHISDQFRLGIEHGIRKFITYMTVIIYHLLISHRSVFIKVTAAVQVCLTVQRTIILGINPAIGIIILADQTAVCNNFHTMYLIAGCIRHIDCVIFLLSFKYIPAGFSIPGKYRIFLCKCIFQILQCKRYRSRLCICEKCIQPDNLLVQKVQVLCHMLDVLCRKHICKNKPCRDACPAEQIRPVALRIFHTAACPADSQIKIINHPVLL